MVHPRAFVNRIFGTDLHAMRILSLGNGVAGVLDWLRRRMTAYDDIVQSHPLTRPPPRSILGIMLRGLSAWLALGLVGCAGMVGDVVDDTTHAGGSAGTKNIDGGQWAGGAGGSGGQWAGGAGGSGGTGTAGTASGGAAGAASTKPYDLPAGRTYDQDLDYIAWDGQVSFVMLKHKDQTALPPSEGGASCSGGCTEQVTKIEDGASIWGRFKGIQGINVQLATTSEAGTGTGVFTACNTQVGSFPMFGSGSGLPGFNNMPLPAWSPPTSAECEWRVKATGGFVYFRAVTVTMPAGSGGTGAGGSGGTGAGGSGGAPS